MNNYKLYITNILFFLLLNCSSIRSLYVNNPNSEMDNMNFSSSPLDLNAVNGELTIEITDDILEGISVYNRDFIFEDGEDPSAAIYKAVDGKKVDGIFVTRWVQEEEASIFNLTSKITTKVKGRGIKIKYQGVEKSREAINNQIYLINSQIDFKKKQISLVKKYLIDSNKFISSKENLNLDF